MMLKPNYDNRLAGVGGDATAGAANGNIIICKHDCKLKRPNMFKNSHCNGSFFLGSKGKRTSSLVLCRQNARLQSA